MKYLDAKVTFAEVPDEISLCISITNCPGTCKNCHSPELREDIGNILNWDSLNALIHINKGITCVCVMGGDANLGEVNDIAQDIKEYYPELKVAWYSGRQELSDKIDLWNFDFIKLGPYTRSLGPLSSRTTNQRFYKVFHFTHGRSELIDITNKFWKEHD